MKHDFRDRAAKIIAEIRTRPCIYKIDVEVLEEILQNELKEYHNELKAYYNEGYDAGYDAGCSKCYALGYSDGAY